MARKERDRYKKPKPKTALGEVNYKILEDYWEKQYNYRPITDLRAARDRLRRAFLALKGLPLPTATIEQLQKALAENLKTDGQRRKVAAALNSVLQHIGRTDVRLRAPKPPTPNPAHLTYDEFLQVLPHIDEEYRTVVVVAFATGARQGEVFGLDKVVPLKRAVYIERQMYPSLKYGPLKNRRPRWVKVIKELWPHVEAWMQVGEEERKLLRNQRWADIVGGACEKAFPKEPEKQLTFHDLRHSYAIYCLSKHMTLEQVAKALGDSIVVVQEYYTGFVLTLNELDGFAI